LFENLLHQPADLVVINLKSKDIEERTKEEIKKSLPFLNILLASEISVQPQQRIGFIEGALLMQDLEEKKTILARLEFLKKETNLVAIQEIAQIYANRFNFYKSALADALNIEKYDNLKFTAHSLKSSSANVGAMKLARLCEYIECSESNQNTLILKIFLEYIFFNYKKSISFMKIFIESRS
jgi:HPt (histidine-containing phosphotransfer) domain-containing protein